MKKTINITLKIEDTDVINFESWLNQQLEVISFKIMPNTEKLYETDEYFKNIVKNVHTVESGAATIKLIGMSFLCAESALA